MLISDFNTKYFDCPQCEIHCKHLPITHAEFAASKDDTVVGKVFLGALGFCQDIIPFKKHIHSPWKCSNCGFKSMRWFNGKIDFDETYDIIH